MIALPTDFATYKWLHLAIWDGASDRIGDLELRTAVIAVTTSKPSAFWIQLARNQGIGLGWDSATREIGTGGSSSADRIIYAELHD